MVTPYNDFLDSAPLYPLEKVPSLEVHPRYPILSSIDLFFTRIDLSQEEWRPSATWTGFDDSKAFYFAEPCLSVPYNDPPHLPLSL